jgi:FMN phosphatase YigB (HAD superfamily)
VGKVTFLVDVDNTLLDNDRITSDLRHYLERQLGREHAESYWAHLVLEVSCYLVDYPFADRLFPHALDVIELLKKKGQVVIVSDGDVVFQPIKIQRSGLSKAVDGHVLIYIHKEKETDDVQQRYPSEHYVMIDDKPNVLAGMKKCCPLVTTVFVRQGQYAHDQQLLASAPQPDVTIERIGDLAQCDLETLISGIQSTH